MNSKLHKHIEQHYSNSQVLPTQPTQMFWAPNLSPKLQTANHEPSQEEEQPFQSYGHLFSNQSDGANEFSELASHQSTIENNLSRHFKPTPSSNKYRTQYVPVACTITLHTNPFKSRNAMIKSVHKNILMEKKAHISGLDHS